MKNEHGGKRKGAGRKPAGAPIEKLCLGLRPDVLTRLNNLCAKWDCGKSAAVTRLINERDF